MIRFGISRLLHTSSVLCLSSSSIATMTYSTQVPEAIKLRQLMEKDKLAKARQLERQKKMGEKQKKRLESIQKQIATREEKQKDKLKKWTLEEKIRRMKMLELEREKRREDRAILRMQRQKEETKEKEQSLAQKEKAKEKLEKKKAGRPKRFFTPLVWYVTQNFKRIAATPEVKANPSKTGVTVMKMAKQEFDALTPEQRAVYEQLFNDDKARYAREMETYRKKKDAAKRPSNAYTLFYTEKFADVSKDLKPVTAAAKKIGEMWNNLAGIEKAVYLDKAAKLKAEYEAKNQKKE